MLSVQRKGSAQSSVRAQLSPEKPGRVAAGSSVHAETNDPISKSEGAAKIAIFAHVPRRTEELSNVLWRVSMTMKMPRAFT
jgi:hypothetical protein